jgi:DNA-binding transcriptional ArsR family regulator
MCASTRHVDRDDPLARGFIGLGLSRTRMEIVRVLAESESSVTELMAATGLSRNGVLRHLRPMVEAGLLGEGLRPTRYRSVTVYVLNRESIENVIWDIFDHIAAFGSVLRWPGHIPRAGGASLG